MSRVLIIEDDPHITELIAIHLKDLNCEVESECHGEDGLKRAIAHPFDLIVLDIMLPGIDGIQICQKLRALDVLTPILMLTAKSEEFDKVLGLESGADDYLTKPFGIREFIARVKAILRREKLRQLQPSSQLIQHDDLSIDLEKHRVLIGQETISLTPKEFDLLALMAANPGKIYSRDELLSTIWGYEFQGYEHTVNSHINRLRAKLEPDVSQPKYILTAWGVGYRFNDQR